MDNPSGLLVDNIQLNPVPEPTTIAFSIAGAGLLVALRSRFKKSS
jgi:PEP-CTERM motif